MNRTGLLVTIMAASLVIPSSLLAGKFRNGSWKKPGGKSSAVSQDTRGNSLAVKTGKKGKVSGKIFFESNDGTQEPMEGCKVCFFDELEGPAPKYDSLWWRIPDYEYESLVDPDGNFDAEVPEGDYVIASVDRLVPDEDFGPPLKGEKVFLSGKIKIKANSKTNLGTGISKKHNREQQSINNLRTEDKTALIEGTLLDADGIPFKGGFVIAYPYGYLSKRTKNDGRFTLYLPEGGQYRLIARNVYGFT